MDPEFNKAFSVASLVPQSQGYFQTSVRHEAHVPAIQPQNSNQDEQFAKNEKVLVFHGAMLYEATIMRVNESRPRKPYFLKFTGFGSKYNTWAGSDILIKDLPENRLYQDELKANLQQSLILKNIGKTPALSPETVNVISNPEAASVPNSNAQNDNSEPHAAPVLLENPQQTTPPESPEPHSHHEDSEATETDSEEEALDQLVQRTKSDGKSNTKSAGIPSEAQITKEAKKKQSDKPKHKSLAGKTKPKEQLQALRTHKKKKTSNTPAPAATGTSEVKVYCICQKPEVWPMIGCDTCADWFHLSCVGLTPSDTDHMETYACPACAKG